MRDIGDIYSAETPPPAESASPAAGFSPVNAPGPSNPSFAVKTPSPSRPSNPPVPQEGEGSRANRSAASGPANPPLPIQFPALVVNLTNAITRLRALIAVRQAALRAGRNFTGSRAANVEAQYVQMIGPIEPAASALKASSEDRAPTAITAAKVPVALSRHPPLPQKWPRP
ncbi:uncharacterized protein L3040_003415 [Drepanopeziza brunnea f. sp. 'multigermtubi']|uniref:uncharacterized protein n=1 Tax=Drepanopeziza brunnea f. sp. 'multigermtubi' TaxID=698441 RepID=UPI0023A4686D|nr:hypothetical protein L3040_003415 [Drepanopeziza brunnea f. sp. 'multigermtubi']